jgi:hypothetical protein
MKYILLIHTDMAAFDGDVEAMYAEYGAFAGSLGEAGKMVAGEELADPATATLVQLRAGERVVTDGPYSATKEHLGGFFVVEAADLDEAIGYAARIPGAKHGTIEVRALAEEQH